MEIQFPSNASDDETSSKIENINSKVYISKAYNFIHNLIIFSVLEIYWKFSKILKSL